MMSKYAKFPPQIAVSERDSSLPGQPFCQRFDIEGAPDEPGELRDLEDGDAVAVYELVQVKTYRNNAYLEDYE